jgi:CubicO group peptidase (beta-lactamase class C family)
MARVLELAGHAPWQDLMQREVFDVADMQHTTHPADRRLIPHRASSYVWTPGGYRHTSLKDLSFLVGAGSLYSTPRDLWQCVRALVDGRYGETAQTYVLRDGGVTWNGVTHGYRTFVDHDATTDRTVVVCANVVTGALDVLRETLPRLLAGETVPSPEIPDVAAMTVDGIDLAPYRGEYNSRPGRDFTVTPQGDHLDIDDWMLVPLGDDAFFCVQDFAHVQFERDAQGVVTKLVWGDTGMEMPRVSTGG